VSVAAVEPVRAEEIRAAAGRLRGVARRTPLERSEHLSRVAGGDVLLKLECLQRTGSFKFRGAFNALALAAGKGVTEVVTASAGNHGLGAAVAARLLGLRSTLFLPAGATMVKRMRVEATAGETHAVEGGYDAAHAAALRHAERTGQHYLHAFADPDVVRGQGTVAFEITEEVQPGTVVIPVGGGGLIAGCGTWLRGEAPGCTVLGAQSVETRSVHDSLAAGEPRDAGGGATICDGLAGSTDAVTLARVDPVVDRIALAEEGEVRHAVRELYLHDGVIAEGSAAVGAAALLAGRLGEVRFPVVLVISGANLDPRLFHEILSG
jgi:threonine dehydratase